MPTKYRRMCSTTIANVIQKQLSVAMVLESNLTLKKGVAAGTTLVAKIKTLQKVARLIIKFWIKIHMFPIENSKLRPIAHMKLLHCEYPVHCRYGQITRNTNHTSMRVLNEEKGYSYKIYTTLPLIKSAINDLFSDTQPGYIYCRNYHALISRFRSIRSRLLTFKLDKAFI